MTKNLNETREPITANVAPINYNDDNSCRNYNNYAERRICFDDSFFTKHDLEILFPNNDNHQLLEKEEPEQVILATVVSGEGNYSQILPKAARETNLNFRAAWRYGPEISNVILRLPNNSYRCYSYTDGNARTFHFNPDDATKCCRRFINSNTTLENIAQSIKSLSPGTKECYENFKLKYEHLNSLRSTSSSVLIGWLGIAVAAILIFIAF